MPCDGPSQEAAYKRANEYAKQLFQYLEKEYDISEPMYLQEDWHKAKAKIEEGLRELFWAESAGNW